MNDPNNCDQPVEHENPALGLRQFVRNPDNEALARAGGEIGNEGLVEEVRDLKSAAIPPEFKLQTPDCELSDDNYNIVAVLAANLLNREDLDTRDAVAELVDQGH